LTWPLLFLGGLVAELIFFWPSWASGFATIYGDIGDPRIVLALLEHWWLWLTGHAQWGSPTFFYPQPGLLGHTDAYLLFAAPYVAFRTLGADAYLAMELSFHAMKLVGYAGMVWLLRRGFGVTLPWAVFGGVLFSVLNGMVWHSIHMQLAAVAITPWLLGVVLLMATQRARCGLFLASPLLLAALFLTSFYTAWFTMLCTGVLLALALVLRAVPFVVWAEWRILLVACLVFLVAMIPFFTLYYPVWLEKQGHAFSTVLEQSLYALELIRVGSSNWVWGWLESMLYAPLGLVTTAAESNYMPDYERISGFTPTVVLVFVLGLVITLRASRRSAQQAAYIAKAHAIRELATLKPGEWGLNSSRLVLAFALTATIFWLLSSRWGEFSPWYWVYSYVPGGAAMRVPSRLLLFLSVFVIPVTVSVLYQWHKSSRYVPVVLAAFLLLEQVNTGPVHNLSRSDELVLLSQISPPPQGCEAFYVSASRPIQTGYSLLDGFYIPNIDAMVLASHWRVPTLNGMSTWAPAGWALERPESPGYEDAVRNWVRLKGLDPATLCALNMQTNTWQFPAFSPAALPRLLTEGDFLSANQQSPHLGMLAKGWSIPEPWGVWSEANHTQLSFYVEKSAHQLVFNLQAYAAEKDPVHVTIALKQQNSGQTHKLTLKDSAPALYRITFDEPLQGKVILDITIHNPRRPLDHGFADTRWLGIGLIGVEVK
jgi:hypothetical protein